MNITTKFAVVNKQGMDALLMLTKTLAEEKYATLIKPKILAEYISVYYNEQKLISEINNFSNQWLIVYADNEPAGYVRLSSKGQRPPSLESRRAVRVADFGILKKYPEAEVRDALFEKCLSVTRQYSNAWMIEYAGNPLLSIFENKGFVRSPESASLEGLPLEAVCLIA
ncbi:N-acetyltransferase [Chitinophaga sp. Cy-1792]|uniref:N-acetyltransferase n=1 Tax=Chitinophaga sp. Cy-1792 TaxID=2608339 RepID=UPI00141EFBD1|nr:N-acetyltransferase [Chitinophaga sp. Cy-1792]NIG54882.1 N-acetyltransferase [Chitinophaga sp. Cy-1792]